MRSAFALRIFSGKNILNFAFVALCGARQTHFHGRGRGGKRHLQRRFLRKRGAAVGVLALTVTFGDNSPKGRALGMTGKFPGVPAPLGGAVAQRLRGFKSAEPEKTVKRSSRRAGVNLQFFPV